MNLRINLIWASLVFVSATTIAAQTVTAPSPSGTTNSVPVFTGSTTVGNSPISVSAGNVGIGTTSPQNLLDVTGNITTVPSGGLWLNESRTSGIADELAGGGSITFRSGNSDNRMDIAANGLIGIGTSNPTAALDIATSYPYALTLRGNGVNPNDAILTMQGGATNGWLQLFSIRTNGNGSVSLNTQNSAMLGFGVSTGTQSGSVVNTLNVAASGNVGIGTTNPQQKLEINGNLRFTVDGSVQTTAWTGVLCGGDYAEDVQTTGSKTAYEPGDVLVISANSDKDVQKSQEPYSTSVAGIYATKPGVIGKRESLAKASDDIPMAMVGIVPTKVSAENGPIRRGDLLVTASKPGYAMKGTDRGKMLGAVIGKAMGTLDSGKGVIEVLVTLQ